MTETDLVTAGDSTDNDKLSNPVTPDTSSDSGANQNHASDGSLATMVLPELRALANKAGVKGTSGMRKNELIAAIRESRQGHANGTPSNGGAATESDNHDAKAATAHRRRRAAIRFQRTELCRRARWRAHRPDRQERPEPER